MNSMELSDMLWKIDQIIVENQKILGNKKDLTDSELEQLSKNRKKISKLFKKIEEGETLNENNCLQK